MTRPVTRPVTRSAAMLLLLAAAVGCGNGLDARQPKNAAVNPATPVPVPSVSATGAVADVAVNRIVDGLRTHGLDSQITDIVVFTPDTDPAHRLGAPGGYVARSTFTDTTLPAAARAQHTFVRGATVEVFRTAADARAGAATAPDHVPGEKDLLSGAVLLRLSPRVPSTLEEKYRSALHEATGTPAVDAG